MDYLSEPTGPQFSAGQELANFLSCCGILERAWEETRNNIFSRTESDGVVFISFPSFCEEDISDGECDIKSGNTVFSDRLKGDDDQPALVHREVLNMFLDIYKDSDLENQMEKLSNQKKEQAVIFVGHSIGGAVATLATICFLDKRLKNIYPLCITFGSPLVGNDSLRESIDSQDWSGRFCHVVSKHDVVPRMLLAPYESIALHWRSRRGNDSVNLRQLLDNVRCLEASGPYKPFGIYVFCSTVGAACIEDSKAVVKMLILTLQSIEENDIAEQNDTVRNLISEHNSYGDLLQHVIRSGYSTKSSNMSNESPIDMAIALQLEAMGFHEAQNKSAFDALKEAIKLKNKHDVEIEKLNMELSKGQSKMAELEWYIKRACEANTCGSYDVFKGLPEIKDFPFNLRRMYLGDFWDEIIEMVKEHELPSDFRYKNKWINAGNAYRRLVEPLDIADYYGVQKKKESYLSIKNRTPRHRVLEKWLKDKNQTRIERGRERRKPRTEFASLTEDSCFWARVEEASKDLENLKQEQEQHQTINAHLKESLENFEYDVSKMIKEKSISKEVFLKDSTFMMWCQRYKGFGDSCPQWKSSFPLLETMKGTKITAYLFEKDTHSGNQASLCSKP